MKNQNLDLNIEELRLEHLDLPCDFRPDSDLMNRVDSACNRADVAGPRCALLIRFAESTAVDVPVSRTGPLTLEVINKFEAMLRRLERGNFCAISLVEGNLRGFASALYLATDFRIATHKSTIAIADNDGTIVPSISLHRMANQVGAGLSRKIALFGQTVTASEAAAIGLAHVIEDDTQYAAERFLRACPPGTLDDLRIRRSLLNEASATTLEQALGTHLAACDRFLRRSI